MKSLKKVDKEPSKILTNRGGRSSKLEFVKSKFSIPVISTPNFHETRPEGCDSDCKHRYNNCKALIDSLSKEVSYEKSQRLVMEQR